MVSEAQGKLWLGLLSMGVGSIGIVTSLLLWQDTPGTFRILGSLSRSLAGIAGVVGFFSGISLLQEVGLRIRSLSSMWRVHSGLLLGIATLSILTVVFALVTYLATITISFH